MICQVCKKTVPDEDLFCQHCGAKLVSSLDGAALKPPVPLITPDVEKIFEAQVPAPQPAEPTPAEVKLPQEPAKADAERSQEILRPEIQKPDLAQSETKKPDPVQPDAQKPDAAQSETQKPDPVQQGDAPFCKFCGALVDAQGICTACKKPQQKQGKKLSPMVWVCGVLAAALIAAVVMIVSVSGTSNQRQAQIDDLTGQLADLKTQYDDAQKRIGDLETDLTGKADEITRLENAAILDAETIDELELEAALLRGDVSEAANKGSALEFIESYLTNNDQTYTASSKSFFTDRSIIVMHLGDENVFFNVGADFPESVTVSLNPVGLAADAFFTDEDWVGVTTPIEVRAKRVGQMTLEIKNSYNDETLKVLVIVVE